MPDVGTGVSAGVGLVGSAMGGDTASSAAEIQSQAGREAIEEQRRQYDLNREDLAPWRKAGSSAVNRLSYLLGLDGASQSASAPNQPTTATQLAQPQGVKATGLYGYNGMPLTSATWQTGAVGSNTFYDPNGAEYTGQIYSKDAQGRNVPIRGAIQSTGTKPLSTSIPGSPTTQPISIKGNGADGQYGSLMRDFTLADFTKDPGYDFRMGEGMKAIERSAAARGGALSGRNIKDVQRFGQDYASNEYGNAFNRYNVNRQTKYNFLSGLAGTGQAAVNTGVASGSNSANNISELLSQIGNVGAASQVAQGNIWSTGLGDLAGSLSKNSDKISKFFS